MTATQMLEQQSKLIKWIGQAQRYLQERDRLDDATENEIMNLAESLRYSEFRRAIEPIERQRSAIMLRFWMLEVQPFGKVPDQIKEAVAMWNEQIWSVAREFGYDPSQFDGGVEHG